MKVHRLASEEAWAHDLYCDGNKVYSRQGLENWERTFRGKGKPVEIKDDYGFWGNTASQEQH